MTRRTIPRPVGATSSILILAILISGLAGCGRGAQEEATSVAEAREATPVRTEILERGDFALTVKLSGSTEARREVDISAELAGSVITFPHELGDPLEEGELILAIDARAYRAAVSQAEAGLLAARSALRQAERNLERSRELKAKGRISDLELESMELAELQARSAVLGGEAALSQAELMLEDAEIRAPFAGRLAYKGVDRHEQIAPGMPVAAVVDLSGVLIRAGLGEQDAVRIGEGMAVEVTIPALGDAQFEGRVKSVGVRSHPATRSYELLIEVDNAEGRILSGMAARGVVTVDTRTAALSVPETSVIEQYGEKLVFVVVDGKVERRAVELGHRQGGRVLVESGLTAGEALIIKGQWSVRDGLAVEIKN
jgi:membrane fusion protein, multidrug efflux system